MAIYVVAGILVILSLIASLAHAGPIPLFIISCVTLVPLAGILGKATEEVAKRQGPAIGGLLNATFGNATELILALMALQKGGALVEMVKASITGSIIGNLLLVLGAAIFFGGLRYKSLPLHPASAGMGSSMMLIAVIGLVVPAVYSAGKPNAHPTLLINLSLLVAGVLITVYLLGLLFSLVTHRHVFTIEDEPEVPDWPLGRAVTVLLVATGLVIMESELLVHAVEQLVESFHLSVVFLGAVVVAIVGNAAEHAVAIIVARKGKMDLAFQIASGSSAQVALFVAPFLVFASYLMGKPMDLLFTPFEVAAVIVSVLIVNTITSDGETNWFEGVQLLGVYALLAVAFFYL